MNPNTYKFILMQLQTFHTRPSVNEYNYLRQVAGWPIYDAPLVEQALANSFFCVLIRDGTGSIVGMGRIVGDNAIYLHIQDVIVRPDLQRQGIGRLIMDELLKYIRKTGGKNTNVGLMCSKGREGFTNAMVL